MCVCVCVCVCVSQGVRAVRAWSASAITGRAPSAARSNTDRHEWAYRPGLYVCNHARRYVVCHNVINTYGPQEPAAFLCIHGLCGRVHRFPRTPCQTCPSPPLSQMYLSRQRRAQQHSGQVRATRMLLLQQDKTIARKREDEHVERITWMAACSKPHCVRVCVCFNRPYRAYKQGARPVCVCVRVCVFAALVGSRAGSAGGAGPGSAVAAAAGAAAARAAAYLRMSRDEIDTLLRARWVSTHIVTRKCAYMRCMHTTDASYRTRSFAVLCLCFTCVCMCMCVCENRGDEGGEGTAIPTTSAAPASPRGLALVASLRSALYKARIALRNAQMSMHLSNTFALGCTRMPGPHLHSDAWAHQQISSVLHLAVRRLRAIAGRGSEHSAEGCTGCDERRNGGAAAGSGGSCGCGSQHAAAAAACS